MMKNSSYIFISGLLFLGVLSSFLLYSNSPAQFHFLHWDIKKSNELKWQQKKAKAIIKKKKKIGAIKDSVKTNSTPQRFLLIGDSQVEGLQYPFYDYCVKNGHTLSMACTWYSSTDKTYASNDTLRHLIAKYKPTHIVFVIGLNQTFETQFEESRIAIDSIKSMFQDIDYSWIGPASWTTDKGINNLYQNEIDSDLFFLSKNLTLERSKDGRHPSKNGYKIWMDSIAYWMQFKSKYKIQMKQPDSTQAKHDYKRLYYSVH